MKIWQSSLCALLVGGLVFASFNALTPGAALGASGPVFTVMNTSETPPDGVWFRNSPHTADTARVTGLGVYMNERVQLQCDAAGDAVGKYNDSLWYFVVDVTRPTNNGVPNQGFLNAHYINDGQTANVVDAGVPACVNNAPPNSSPPPTPAPNPPAPPPSSSSAPTPTQTPVPSNVKTVVNADGGIYWRSGPDWSFVVTDPGHGIYTGDRVNLNCFVNGGTVPPLNSNALWYFASIYSGRGIGQGYLNDHFLNTGLNVPNQVVPGVPACVITGGAGGGSGGGLPTYSLPPPLPQPGSQSS